MIFILSVAEVCSRTERTPYGRGCGLDVNNTARVNVYYVSCGQLGASVDYRAVEDDFM